MQSNGSLELPALAKEIAEHMMQIDKIRVDAHHFDKRIDRLIRLAVQKHGKARANMLREDSSCRPAGVDRALGRTSRQRRAPARIRSTSIRNPSERKDRKSVEKCAETTTLDAESDILARGDAKRRERKDPDFDVHTEKREQYRKITPPFLFTDSVWEVRCRAPLEHQRSKSSTRSRRPLPALKKTVYRAFTATGEPS